MRMRFLHETMATSLHDETSDYHIRVQVLSCCECSNKYTAGESQCLSGKP